MILKRFAYLFGICIAFAANAADAPAVIIKGAVQSPQQVTFEYLRTLPFVELEVAFKTRDGDRHARFRGVLLWTLIERAGGIGKAGGMRDKLRHVIMVTGRDGYAIALSEGEIDPEFAGKAVILALERDGTPLTPEEGIRLVVPEDRRSGRSVRDVAEIEVK